MQKVDVCINVYGKPWTTLVALTSLMHYSGQYIDKIYFIEEKQQPYNDNLNIVLKHFNNIIHFIPRKYEFLPRVNNSIDYKDEVNRYDFRYQYGIENSNKKFLFITHNDVKYTGDIIGEMLKQIDDAAGIGFIGQCWNCPANYAGECSGEEFNSYEPTYKHILYLCKEFPPARGQQFMSMVNPNKVMPLPECRLNEFACLINREITMKECIPNGDVPFFGEYSGIDLNSTWFEQLIDKGYKFKNYDIEKNLIHGYENRNHSGNSTLTNEDFYNLDEIESKKFYMQKNCNNNQYESAKKRTIVIATNNGKDNLIGLLDSLEKIGNKYDVAIIDTQSNEQESIDYLNNLEMYKYSFNIKVYQTPYKGYDTGAYIYAINNIESDYYYFIQDSLKIKTIDFFHECNHKLDNGYVVSLLTFNANFFDQQDEIRFCYEHFGTIESDGGIFGPMFAISSESINLIDKKYLVYPTNKVEQMAMERGWGIIFNKYSMSVTSLEGVFDLNKLQTDGYNYFTKIFKGRQ